MSNQTISLTVKPRKITGRKVKSLRRQNIIPANIFGKKIKSQNIQVSDKDFLKAYKQAGETSVIELQVEGSKTSNPVLVSNVQTHPASGEIVHVDFHQIDLKEKVTATVPLELIGESPAVKEKGGVLFSTMSELEVTALPTNIPSVLQIDISNLAEIGDTLSLKNLKTDTSKLEFEINLEEPLVIIQEQKAAEEPEPTPEDAEAEEGGADQPAEAEEAQAEKPASTEKAEAEAKADQPKEDKQAE